MYLFRIQPPNFSPSLEVAGCFCIYQGNLLFLQRSETQILANQWGIPQGKLEKGETPLEAVIRELQEETGIFVPEEEVESLGAVYMKVPNADFTFHLFKTELASLPSITLNRENKDFSWSSKEEMGRLALMLGLEECVAYFVP